MSLIDELKSEVSEIFAGLWQTTEGRVVPAPEDLTLGNDARRFERATILYADLSGSTALVDGQKWFVAGEIYKTYLSCSAKIILSLRGTITSYDGDRVMAVFTGGNQTSTAAKCALQINWAVRNVIHPMLKAQYPELGLTVKQVVGIDTGEVRAARIGIRGGNDLVWIGRPANYAAKLTTCPDSKATWITKAAYDWLHVSSKMGGTPQQDMWTPYDWNAMGGVRIYGSSFTWKP